MSFIQCLELPGKHPRVLAKSLTVCEQLARDLPGKRVYSVGEIERLCRQVADGGSRQVLEALKDVGVLTLYTTEYCTRCGLLVGMCLCESALVELDERYEVTGDPMALIADLRGERYFISFYNAEARDQAEALHQALHNNGIAGFVSCSELGTGDDWKSVILQNLKESSVFFCLESPNYHSRERCKIERDFAVAAGMRFVRVGLCQRQDIAGAPAYLSGLQHDCFVDNAGRFQLNQRLLGQNLPGHLSLHMRKSGARSLFARFTLDVITDYASQIDVQDEIPEGRSLSATRTAFLNSVFHSVNRADQLCQVIDPVSIF